MDSRLAGLEEKSRILNNDELADALHDRISELSSRTEKFIPEVLSLLLQLSDRPIQYSRIEDLELLKPKPLPAPLTWAEILEDDPLDNQDGLWDNIDFARDSDEEIKDFRKKSKYSNKDKQEPDEESTDSDEDARDVLRDHDSSDLAEEKYDGETDSKFHADQYEVIYDNQIIEDLMNAPYWGSRKILEDSSNDSFVSAESSTSMKLTEAQLKREVIFMLLGLPTPICRQSLEGQLNIEFLEIETGHMSQEALKHLLGEFAGLSDSLATVRNWARKTETVALLQAFQAGLSSRINVVEKALSDVQSRMLDPSSDSTASLLDLFNEASTLTCVIQQIAPILDNLQSVPAASVPFVLLERLYDRACLNDIIEDPNRYLTMTNIFFECFDTYLRPVEAWMKFGILNKHENAFFIRENDLEVAPDKFWQDQFQLIKTMDGNNLPAPRFLHSAAQKIFTTGKTINFLERLGRFHLAPDPFTLRSQKLNYETVCGDNADVLTPFSTLFDIALERWIADFHQASSHRLREILETDCGLESSLDALEILYFNRDGARSGDIAKMIFDRIDNNIERWNDGFLLTEFFQGVLSTHPSIEVDHLAVHSMRKSGQVVLDKQRSVKILDGFKAWYHLPWPITNIIKSESIDVYQRIFLILYQTQRAKHTLQQKHLMKRILCPSKNEKREYRLTYHLRQCLLWFTNLLFTYLTNSVLWVETEAMRHLMTKAADVDEMIAVHERYISRLENQCLISKQLAPIHQAVIAILDLSILFSDAHTSHQAQLIISRPVTKTTGKARGVSRKSRRKLQGTTRTSESSDSDSDEQGDRYEEADLSYISFGAMPYAERLKKMQASFMALVSSVIAGLYDAHEKAQGGGEPCWEMLADSLAIGLRREEDS